MNVHFLERPVLLHAIISASNPIICVKPDKKIIALIIVAAIAASYVTGLILTQLTARLEPKILREMAFAESLKAPMKLAIPAATITTATLTKSTQPAPQVEISQAGRMLIRTASLEMESDDPEKAVNEIIMIVESYGGYVAWMSIKSQEPPSANLIIKVPEKYFFQALREIRSVGKVLKEEVNARDVTEQYVDLEARLRNLKAEEEWLLKAVEKAKSVQDLIMIEKELWRVRGEIERLEAQLRNLERMVEYSSISISIKAPEKPKPPPSPYPKLDLTPILVIAATALIYILYGLIFLIIVGAPLTAIVYAGYKIYQKLAKRMRR